MKPLTVITDILPGAVSGLEDVFRQIQGDEAGNAFVRFPDSPSTHFARWVILHDDEFGPRLLFATDYDGDLQTYLSELDRVLIDPDAIWGRCANYPGRHGLREYLLQHMQKNRAVYVGFPGETASSILAKRDVREDLESVLDSPEMQRNLTPEKFAQLVRNMALSQRPPGAVQRAVDRAVHVLSSGVRAINNEIMGDILTLGKWYADLGVDLDFSRVSSQCGSQIRPLSPDLNNLIASNTTQSSFTVYAKVKPGRLLRIRFALMVATLIAQFGYPPGNFANVFTLHSYRWCILNGGRRLIFMSVFDGSWENYMGDFIDNLVWALDAIYANTEDYPEGGMREVYAFKDWIRRHQPVPNVVYNAYPSETVLKLRRDRAISHTLATAGDPRSLQELMRLL